MKIKIFLLCLLYLATCFSQTVKISGRVKNFDKEEIYLKGYKFKERIEFNKNTNSFSKEFKSIKEGIYALAFKRRLIPVYIESGKDIKITFDYKKRFVSPVFTGDLSAINTYLTERKKVFIKELGSTNKLFRSNEVDFLNSMQKFKKSMNQLLKKSKLTKKFRDYEKRNIKYGYVRSIQNFESYHRTLNRKENFEVSEHFPNFDNSIDYNRGEDYYFSLDYRNLIQDHFQRIATELEEEGDAYEESFFSVVCEEVTNKTIKNDLLYNLVTTKIIDAQNPLELCKKIKNNITDESMLDEINTIYKRLKKLSRGKKSPKFKNLTNLKEKTVSLDDLIKNKKFTCIYFWATWCKYCKNELALISLLSKEHDMSNIQFVGINIDKANKKRKWKKMIAQYNLIGEHLFAGKTQNELEFAKEYMVKGVPRFILLDNKRKIISFNVPRPDPEQDGYQFIEFLKENKAIK